MSDLQDTKASFITRGNLYSTLCTIWASHAAATNTLLNGHMVAHSFIIVACATLLSQGQGKVSSMVALAIVSVGGLVLSILTSAAWARNTARGRLLAWHLEQLEADTEQPNAPRNDRWTHVFMDMRRVANGKCILSRHQEMLPFTPNLATRRAEAAWLKPERTIPYVLDAFYAMFLTLAVYNLVPLSACAAIAAIAALSLLWLISFLATMKGISAMHRRT